MKNIHRVFALIVLLLSVEYLTFGGGLSVFRILILPLAVLGLFLMKNFSLKRSSAILWYCLMFYFAWVIGSNYFIGNPGDSVTYFLIAIFSIFLIKYFSAFPKEMNSLYKYTYWFALPHEIVYLLILGGFLSMSDYTIDYAVRFIGFHRDPNFMTIFISIGVLSKVQYLWMEKTHIAWKLITAATIVLDIWLVVLGMSRGGLVCLLAFMALQMFVFISGTKKFVAAGFMIVLVSSFLIYARQFTDIPGTYQSSFHNMLARFNADDFSEGSGRKDIWRENMQEIVKFPLTPLGTNLEERPEIMFTHNTYIDILLTSGVVCGALFVVLLVVAQGYGFVQVLRNGAESGYLILALLVIAQLFFLSLLTVKLTWFVFIILLHNLTNKIHLPDYGTVPLSLKMYNS